MFGQPTAREGNEPENEDLDVLLTDPHCRYLLAFLWRTEGPTTVDTAARQVVGELTGVDPGAVPENVQRRVGTWLHHGVVPTLADQGLVAFDPACGTVELTEATAPRDC